MGDAILELKDVCAGYGKAEVLHDVTIDVWPGEMVCVIGPNGAGKTTMLGSIFGLTDLYSGHIILAGEDITGVRTHERIHKSIAFIPQEKNVFPTLSVEENLQVGYDARRLGKLSDILESVYSQFPRLKERRRQRVGTLSGGERRMCAIGIGLMTAPKVLLLDEPSLGLAPIVVQQLFAHIQEINLQGITILLVEQNARRALAISGRGYVLELGQIKHQGTGQDLANDPEVQRLYLGGD
jgi:ABC-type branched-subunit amino acid transport system ATPase component